MPTGKHIEYVDLRPFGPSETLASFFFRRFLQTTFRPSAAEVPHRHNYHELFVVQAGRGEHAIDGQPTALLPGTVSVITKGQVHTVEYFTELTGWLIRFSDDFLTADMFTPVGSNYVTLFNQLGHNHTITIGQEDLYELGRLLDLIEFEWSQPTTMQKEQVLRHLLSVLIIRLARIFENVLGTPDHELDPHRVYQHFMTLLEAQFAAHHDVQYYADALHVSPIRLSRALNRVLGKATKQVIDERIVLEAKRYLHYTDLSVTEIAAALGYTDLFHLSKTFKRLTGVAPQTFREQRQKVT